MKLEIGKLYKTRSSLKARVYAVGDCCDGTIHGATQTHNGSWQSTVWDCDGGRYLLKSESPYDIISEWKEPMKFEAEIYWDSCGKLAVPFFTNDSCLPEMLLGKRGRLTFVESEE